MTVFPAFGWQLLLTFLGLSVAVAVLFFVLTAAGRAEDRRSEWQAWLDDRSSRRRYPPDLPVEPLPEPERVSGQGRPDSPG